MPTNRDAARSGSTLEALTALRDTLAGLLDDTEAQVHAQLAAQYRATLADIAALGEGAKPKGLRDELKAKRDSKDRGATSNASANA